MTITTPAKRETSGQYRDEVIAGQYMTTVKTKGTLAPEGHMMC
nr:hypothetical protein [Leuconostoc holzapfelii]